MTEAAVDLKQWSDPVWRLNNIYWVLTDEGKEVPFVMRPEQRELLENLHNRNIILKARQLGFSTFVSLLQLDQCIWNKNFKSVTIADTLPNAMEIFRTKIEYPWLRLPEALRKTLGVATDSKTELVFNNGSSISVTTSARGGTLQSLHISEFGRICAKFPEKASEIVSGSFEAVTLNGGMIFVESTAKGQAGRFFDMTDAALKRQQQKTSPTKLDFRLHFFPWWKKTANVLEPKGVILNQAMMDYFARLKQEHGIVLTPEQRAWYAKTAEALGDDRKSEHPSFPEEAFEVAVDGAIYAKEMSRLRMSGAIGGYPWVPNIPVNTFWDLGVSKGNAMAIWFHQRVNGRNRLINYIEGTNEGYGYFVNEMNKFGYVWGKDYWPHDVRARKAGIQITTPEQTLASLGRRNYVVVPAVPYKNMAVEALRSFLMTVEIDARECVDGIRALDSYQREWDEKAGRWSDRPLHNWASNAVDALQQGAQGYEPDTTEWAPIPRYDDEPLDAEIGY